jgi:hypothetical protein
MVAETHKFSQYRKEEVAEREREYIPFLTLLSDTTIFIYANNKIKI